MDEEKVTLEISVQMDDVSEALDSASDNAWEHAKESAEVMGFELGDDEFGVIFQELHKRYSHNVEHLQFFMATSMLLIKTLLDSGIVTLITEDKQYEQAELADKISKMANTIVNSYMWIASGYELTWLSNEEMPENVKVKYDFDPNDIIIDEEEL